MQQDHSKKPILGRLRLTPGCAGVVAFVLLVSAIAVAVPVLYNVGKAESYDHAIQQSQEADTTEEVYSEEDCEQAADDGDQLDQDCASEEILALLDNETKPKSVRRGTKRPFPCLTGPNSPIFYKDDTNNNHKSFRPQSKRQRCPSSYPSPQTFSPIVSKTNESLSQGPFTEILRPSTALQEDPVIMNCDEPVPDPPFKADTKEIIVESPATFHDSQFIEADTKEIAVESPATSPDLQSSKADTKEIILESPATSPDLQSSKADTKEITVEILAASPDSQFFKAGAEEITVESPAPSPDSQSSDHLTAIEKQQPQPARSTTASISSTIDTASVYGKPMQIASAVEVH